MQVQIDTEVLKNMASYVGATQPIVEAHASLQAKHAELQTNFQKLETAKQATVEAIADILVANQVIPAAERASAITKMAASLDVVKQAITAGLQKRALAADTLGSGILPADGAPAARKGDEFDVFVRQ